MTIIAAVATALTAFAPITMTSCGGNKSTDGNTEVATEQAEEQAEFNGETYSKDAAEYYMKHSYGINLADVAPDRKYDENVKGGFMGRPRETAACFRVVEGEKFNEAEFETAVRKAYAATKAVSDDNKCVYGYEEKDSKAEAMAEKPLEEALKGTEIMGFKVNQYGWSFTKDGKLCRCMISAAEKEGEDVGYIVSIYDALNKTVDEAFDDAAKAVEEIENDPAKKAQVDKALKDAGLK